MDGAEYTRLEHYQNIAERTGQDLPELNGPEMPDIVAHVWEWFLQLSAARQQGALSYSEIKAWSELTHTPITPFELELIKALDTEFLTQQHKQQSQSLNRG